MGQPHATSPDELYRLLGAPDAPLILDLRLQEDFDLCPRVIPGARRADFANAHERVLAMPEQAVIVVCHKGFKISQGAAARMRANGCSATYLSGGNVGWAEADLPLWPAPQHSAFLSTPSEGVLSTLPDAATIFSAWAVQRFLEPQIQWLFVEPDQVGLVADRFEAQEPSARLAPIIERSDATATKLRICRETASHQPISSLLKAAFLSSSAESTGLGRAFAILDAVWADQKRQDAA